MFLKYIRALSVLPTILPYEPYRPELAVLSQRKAASVTISDEMLMYLLFAPN
jgi:hypothetical protein